MKMIETLNSLKHNTILTNHYYR